MGLIKDMEKLVVGNTEIEYEVTVSGRAQRIRITINGDKVKVTKPKGANDKEVKDFVEAKKEWIFNHWQEFKSLKVKQEEKKFVAGEKFPYLGYEYMLRIIAINNKKATVELKSNILWVFLPDNLSEEEWPLRVKEALLAWYKNEARQVFTDKLEVWSKRMGVRYNQLRIKEQKTRWGSCSGKGNINLNWRVIMAPKSVIDYLIVHELAHLKQMNHSKEFWQLVKNNLFDYERQRKWLREEGKKLPFAN